MLRPAEPADTPALVALAAATGIFKPNEAESLLGGVLTELHGGRLGAGHSAQVWCEAPDRPPAGWVYFAPVENTDGVWNLWWIGVEPTRQRQGIGEELLRFVEEHVRSAGGRLLLIETSSKSSFDAVRRFYAKRGYADCGCIPDFYADGDGKVTFVKRVSASPPARSVAGDPA
jgi:ribosomal protein S18 acetylase RimI-like enzyme